MNENDFSSLVRGWATAALEQNPGLNVDGLVRALPGVYPSDLARILEDQWGRLLRRSNPGAGSFCPSNEDGFPVPHPLDYDWRFTQETRVLLSKMVAMLLPQRGSVTLLGAPTLFENLVKLRTDAIIRLADGSVDNILFLSTNYSKGQLYACDLLQECIPQIFVDAVVADPPWYPEFSEAFVWTAGEIVRVGGHLLLCGPNLGTRPDATEEWEHVKVYAASLGFDLVSFESSLRYQTPPFEQNALNAAGHKSVSPDWRTGCLATFVRERVSVVQRPIVPSSYTLWHQENVGGVRWRLRRMEDCIPVSPLLSEIVINDVLDSVSRRDLRRLAVDVWTSGNRVFGCSDTSTLKLILRAVKTDVSPITFVETATERKLTIAETSAVNAAARSVAEILSLEQQEYVHLTEDLSVS